MREAQADEFPGIRQATDVVGDPHDLAEEHFSALGVAFWLSSTEAAKGRSQMFHEALGFRRIGTLQQPGQDAGEIFYRRT